MKINQRLLTVFMAICAFACTAFAGDYANLNFIGFSNNGLYLAFEEYGVQDGSGFPYSNIYFVETAKNVYAAPRVRVVIESETATEKTARDRAALQAAKNLKRFGIVKGNTGKQVISHTMNDLAFEDEKVANEVKFVEVIGSMYRQGEHKLTLDLIKVSTKDCEAYGDDTFMIDLKLTRMDDNVTRSLQKDTSLPPGRGCALGYRLQDVYLYKDTIAVFINVFNQGFEGPDMRFMAVTGPLR